MLERRKKTKKMWTSCAQNFFNSLCLILLRLFFLFSHHSQLLNILHLFPLFFALWWQFFKFFHKLLISSFFSCKLVSFNYFLPSRIKVDTKVKNFCRFLSIRIMYKNLWVAPQAKKCLWADFCVWMHIWDCMEMEIKK